VGRSEDPRADKIDEVIRLLEDTFILQALSLGVGREEIRKILRVAPNRISKINKGLTKKRKLNAPGA
jgi:hypothetical protein